MPPPARAERHDPVAQRHLFAVADHDTERLLRRIAIAAEEIHPDHIGAGRRLFEEHVLHRIAAQPGAIGAIRWFGAGYLLWLAWCSWHAGGAEAQGGLRSPVAAFRRGFLTNILNPKVILFMIAWLPQFTDPAWGPVWQQMLLLGGAFCVSGTVVTVGYGLVAGWLGARLARRMRVMNRVASVMFAGLAARLVAA